MDENWKSLLGTEEEIAWRIRVLKRTSRSALIPDSNPASKAGRILSLKIYMW